MTVCTVRTVPINTCTIRRVSMLCVMIVNSVFPPWTVPMRISPPLIKCTKNKRNNSAVTNALTRLTAVLLTISNHSPPAIHSFSEQQSVCQNQILLKNHNPSSSRIRFSLRIIIRPLPGSDSPAQKDTSVLRSRRKTPSTLQSHHNAHTTLLKA